MKRADFWIVLLCLALVAAGLQLFKEPAQTAGRPAFLASSGYVSPRDPPEVSSLEYIPKSSLPVIALEDGEQGASGDPMRNPSSVFPAPSKVPAAAPKPKFLLLPAVFQGSKPSSVSSSAFLAAPPDAVKKSDPPASPQPAVPRPAQPKRVMTAVR